MLGVGHLPQIALLLVVALLIFGPKKLPELGSAFGRSIREFKDATSAPSTTEPPHIQHLPAAAPAPQLAQAPVLPMTDRASRAQQQAV